MGVTQELMTFLVESQHKQFRSELIDRAKILTVDFIGGALAGVRTEVGKIMTEYVKAMDARPEYYTVKIMVVNRLTLLAMLRFLKCHNPLETPYCCV